MNPRTHGGVEGLTALIADCAVGAVFVIDSDSVLEPGD
jgi:hypothetical protein